jgi:hypothetical protein
MVLMNVFIYQLFGIKTNISENIGLEEVGIATDKDKNPCKRLQCCPYQDTTPFW